MNSLRYCPARERAARHGSLFFLCTCLLLPSFALSQVQVLTEHNDLARSGTNTNEALLTPANVNLNFFGKLFTQNVDGYVVAQPLYLSAVAFPDGSTHNVVFVATQHDSVFAFDADSPQAPLWSTSFIDPSMGITTVPIADYGCAGTGFSEIGIVSTPVIDPSTANLYVVAKTFENGAYVYRLHALSLTSGVDTAPPTVISASAETNQGTIQLNPAIEMQRPALLLANNTIYIGFASNGCDSYGFKGWLLAYDETSLQQVGAFLTTPNGKAGGIWQSGGGPAADTDGTIFLATANGTFDANTGGSDYGDSVIHFTAAGSPLAVLDYFTPYDQQNLFKSDLDLGSGGVVLLPDQDGPPIHEMVAGGKEGTLYLLDRDNLGGYNPGSDSQIIQSIPGASAHELLSVPGYWNGSVYILGSADDVKAFSLSNGTLSLQPASQTSAPMGPGSVSISSNGPNSGILWVTRGVNPATLYAFDASDLTTMLYNSGQAKASRDKLGSVPKFVAPTIATGKVYLGGTKALTVYGLLPLLLPVSGNNQSGYERTTLPLPLQLQSIDAYQGNPISNVPVTCKDGGAGGTFAATMPILTDSQGQAFTNYTLPRKGDSVTITCTSVGFITGSFSEISIPGPIYRQAIIAGNRQTGPVSTPLPIALTVAVYDPYGLGIPGLEVDFSDGGIGGSFSATSVITDIRGRASTVYTTPSNTGIVSITASTAGLAPAKFAVTVQ